MKIIKILSLICFFVIGILAQTSATISGKVTEKGKPFANVTVILKTKKVEIARTITDLNGNYKFENVVAGEYEISIEWNEGIAMQTVIVRKNKPFTATSFDFETDITFGLKNSIQESVTISANLSQRLEEVSKSVNIIDSQELRDRADFSLVESLRTIPGFRIQQLGGFGRTANIKTRGLRNQDTAILIDGIRFRDASAITGDATPFLSDFTLTSVNRIEVLRGSGSSLYGTNAIGGTIDFQTPKPAAGFHGQFGGAFGGYGLRRFRGNVSDGTKDGQFGFNLGLSRTVYLRGIDGEDDAANTNFQSRIEYNPFAKTNFSGRFFVSDAYVRLNSNPQPIGVLPASVRTIINAVPLSRSELRRFENGTPASALNLNGANFIPDANDPDNNQKSQFFAGQFAVTQIISNKLFVRGSYQFLRTSRKNDNGIRGIGFQSANTGIFKGIIQTANAQVNYTPVRSNELTVGYEYEREKFGNDGFTPSGANNFFTRAFQTSNTVYVQDLLRLFDGKLQLAGGARAQFFNLRAPEFSTVNALYSNLTLENPPTAYTFDGAASYFFNRTGTKIRAHIGNGYRVPSLYERFGSTFFFGFTALGDPNLRPERTIAFDGGVDQSFYRNRVKLSAVYFYTRLLNTIGFLSPAPRIGTTTRPFGGYLNTKGGIARGAEFSGDFKATRSTDIFASYTYTNSDQRTPQGANTGILTTLGIPNNQFTLVATQRIRRAWVNFDFLAASSYLAPLGFPTRIYRFKGNRRGDLTGGYTFRLNREDLSLRVFGTIENIFGDDYYENGFRTFDRNGRVGFSFGF